MKKLLFILAILLISTTWSKGQIFNTGQTKPTVITPLQGNDPISHYLDKIDTVLWAKLGRFGDYKLWSAKKIRHVLDSLANAKQDTINLTTIGTGVATFDGHVLNIPTNSGVGSDTLFTTIAISDETTALTTGAAKVTFRMPIACTLTKVRASVTTAPTGANLIFDINENGTSVLSTKLSIDATEKVSVTAASQPVISDSSILDYSEMTIDIDQVGSTIAGTGAKIIIYYIKN